MGSDGSRHLQQTGTTALEQIDLKDERFRITTCRDLDELSTSIHRLGLLVPPLVRPESGAWTVISGFKRIAACRRLGWDCLPVRMLQSDCTDYDCARQAVGENSMQRPLNPIEISLALGLLERCAPGGMIPAEDLTALGLPANARMVSRLKTLTALPHPLQAGILEGSIPLAVAWGLGELEKPAAVRLAELLRPLRISLNKQRELIALVQEIALREAIPLTTLLNDPQVTAIADGDESDRNQKAHRLRSMLRRRRYPAMAATEDNFHNLRNRLKLGDGIQLTPPRDFEDRSFSLTLNFNGLGDLARLKDKLDELLHHPDLDRILNEKSRQFESGRTR